MLQLYVVLAQAHVAPVFERLAGVAFVDAFFRFLRHEYDLLYPHENAAHTVTGGSPHLLVFSSFIFR